MKKILYTLITLFSLLTIQAQEVREDDLGDVSDEFQTAFFEAIKQKGIENYDKAIDLLINCKTMAPNNAAVYFELGKNYYELDKWQLAKESLQKANELKPNNQWVLNALYKLYKAQNNSIKIVETLQILITLKPNYSEDLIGFYLINKQYDEALDLVEKLDQENGIKKRRENTRYQIYSRGQKFNEQAAYIEKKVTTNTASELEYVTLIYTYSRLNDPKKGFDTAKLFLKSYPESDKPHLSLYKYYLINNDTKKAISAMHRVVNSSLLNDNEKYKVLNDFFNFTKNNLSYLPELEKAIEKFPHETILSKMALLYKDTNNKKASEYIDAASKNTSNSFEDLRLIGTLLLKEKNIKAALKNSNKALELYPAQPVFYLQKAKALNLKKQPKKALLSLEFGLDYLIDNTKMEAEFYLEMANAYQQLNDLKNQKKYLQKAKNLNN